MDPPDAHKLQLQQQNSSQDGEYTHGGVKKTKFEPKVPTRRLKKLSATAKTELQQQQLPGLEGFVAAAAAGSGEITKELQRLLESDRRARDRSHQRTSTVTFGFGGYSAAAASSPSRSQQNRGVGAASRSGGSVASGLETRAAVGSNVRRGGSVGAVSRRSGSSGISEGGASGARTFNSLVEKEEFTPADGTLVEFLRNGESRNVEVFDHEKYYPVTLPLRKPIVGVDVRRLDIDEFRDGEEIQEDDEEDGTEAAEELGLDTDPTDEDALFFFQFPKGLPLSLTPSAKERKPASARSARLEDLGKGGAMGKLLVYESGAVKLKIGDVVFDALPGTECTFAQEVAAVNATAKQCSFVGEVHKKVVLTPDIVDVLPDLTDLRAKSS